MKSKDTPIAVAIIQSDIEISSWPRSPEGGMQTGKVGAGVEIKHIPSGLVVTCNIFRQQTKNREHALAELTIKLKGGCNYV